MEESPLTLYPPRLFTTQVKVASRPWATVTFPIGFRKSGSKPDTTPETQFCLSEVMISHHHRLFAALGPRFGNISHPPVTESNRRVAAYWQLQTIFHSNSSCIQMLKKSYHFTYNIKLILEMPTKRVIILTKTKYSF